MINSKIISLQNTTRFWRSVVAASVGKAELSPRIKLSQEDLDFLRFTVPNYSYQPERERLCWEELNRVHPDWKAYSFKDDALRHILVEREKLAFSCSYSDLVSIQEADASQLKKMLSKAFQLALDGLGVHQSTDLIGRLPSAPSYWHFGLPYTAISCTKEGKKSSGTLVLTAYPSLFSEDNWDIGIKVMGIKTIALMSRFEGAIPRILEHIESELSINCVQLPYDKKG